jgi:hypothetical protein
MPITINFQGRLGNQLFQYSSIRSLSIIKGYDYAINTNFKDHTGEPCMLKYFNIKNTNELYNSSNFINKYQQPFNSYFFDNNIYNIKDNTALTGFFENIDYFKEHKEIIQNELKIIDKNINTRVDNYINEIVKNNEKLIGVHCRRGDIVQQLNELTGQTIEEFNIKMKCFINKSLETINIYEKNITLLLFTGGIRKCGDGKGWIKHSHEDDVLWLNQFILENEINCKIHISPGSLENNELIDFDLMSKCDYLIIPYKSTFSFMAYYLSKKCIKLFSPTNLYGYNVNE